MRPGTRITDARGWSGTVIGMQKTYILAQGPPTNDETRGMRSFRPEQVSAVGGQAFATKSIPATRRPGTASPRRKEAAAALAREDKTRDTWRRLAPAY